MKLKRITISVNPEVYRELTKLAQAQRRSVSSMTNELLYHQLITVPLREGRGEARKTH